MSVEDDMVDIDPYNILGVNKTSELKEIKKAYHKLCLKYHPDKNSGFRKEFDQVQISYMVLSDDKKRARYDKTGVINLKDGVEGDEEFDWRDYFKTQFDSISKELIEKDREEYQGSKDEEEDIKRELLDMKGDMRKLFETVIHLEFSVDEEKRVFEICQRLIDDEEIDIKDIPQWGKYVKNRKENVKKMDRKRRREEKAAEKAEKVRKDEEREDNGGMAGLQALIASNASRHRDIFGSIAAKYEAEEEERKKKKRRKTKKT